MGSIRYPEDAGRRRARRRTRALAFVCALWLTAIVARLVQLQIFGHARAVIQVVEQNRGRTNIQPRRGTIYDRKGKILARSLPARSIYYLPNPSDAPPARFKPIERLAGALGLSVADLERFRGQLEKAPHFLWLKRQADPALAAQVAKARSGIGYQEETKRFYPLGPLAAQVLGGVNIDEKGIAGIEYRFNTVLQGKKGHALILLDGKRSEYHYEILDEPEDGRDVVLTLDETIQYFAQVELQKAVAETRAAWGTVIVSQPGTGEILAMATTPGFDPNAFPSEPGADMNRAVRQTYEPGSTFKIVTAAAALENQAVSLADVFDCREGSIAVAGGAIRDHERFGVLSFPEVIIHSSNVGAVLIGQRLGAESLHRMIETLGFGRKTGIELPGEEAGRLAPVEKWSRRSQPALSIGYEIAVTPLQVLQAMNIVANRGVFVAPRIIKTVEGSRPRPDAQPRVLVSADVCEKLVAILARVAAEGTGRAARIDGFTVAGKTGTTQKFDPLLKAFSTKRHTASFVGFLPAENPVLSIIVVLDDPQSEAQYGGQVAAPVFREIARRALRYLGVHPRRGGLLLAARGPQKGRP